MALPDGEYVRGADVARALAGYRYREGHEQRSAAGKRGGAQGRGQVVTNGRWDMASMYAEIDEPDVRPVTEQEKLAGRTGLSVQIVAKYVNGTYATWVPFARADLLLTAAGQQHRFLSDVPVIVFKKGQPT